MLLCGLSSLMYTPIYQNYSIYFEANISAAPHSRNLEIFPKTQSPISLRALFVLTISFDMATLLISQQMSNLKTLTMDYFYFHLFIVASPQTVFDLVEEIILWYSTSQSYWLFTKYGYYRIGQKGSEVA